ncbi:dihydroxyacetone kinase ADP-binding subunit DhaL [Photobacterium sagamiensis]|uniref:dihydroxyacetone kinase subunit DhaL n=1 Tax=Photobacterium sagamiensis TaxID=2910241 RepID=UPI003D0D9CF9
MRVTKQHIVKWLETAADLFAQQENYLTELDREIGDADHGLNMNRGFRKVMEKLPAMADKDIGTVLKTTGMTLLSSIGGASGPLYGTFFIRAASSVMGKEELTLEELVTILDDGVKGVQQRGRAEAGDKTMVDTWLAVINSLQQQPGNELGVALEQAAQAAEKGMKATIEMQARKGRASYLGERSIGHQDPGATSSYFLFTALCDNVLN